jgi:magnesium chelatase subunit H
MLELEYTLIPHGLHVVGNAAMPGERAETARLPIAESARHDRAAPKTSMTRSLPAVTPRPSMPAGRMARRGRTCADRALARANTTGSGEDHELAGLVRALDGRFVRPAPGGDLLRTPDILPTGPQHARLRSLPHPPSAFAVKDGSAAGAQSCSSATLTDRRRCPKPVAMVLWGTDNLKTEGGPIAQAWR